MREDNDDLYIEKIEIENDKLRVENERLRAALQWIEAQVGQKDAELVRAMCKRALVGKDPANIYVEQ